MKLRFANLLKVRNEFAPAPVSLRAVLVCAAAIGIAACSTPDHRTPDERAEDRATVDRVQLALQADAQIYAHHIEVSSRSGVVWLTGWVSSAEEAAAATRDTRSVPGVKRVINDIDLMDWATHY